MGTGRKLLCSKIIWNTFGRTVRWRWVFSSFAEENFSSSKTHGFLVQKQSYSPMQGNLRTKWPQQDPESRDDFCLFAGYRIVGPEGILREVHFITLLGRAHCSLFNMAHILCKSISVPVSFGNLFPWPRRLRFKNTSPVVNLPSSSLSLSAAENTCTFHIFNSNPCSSE